MSTESTDQATTGKSLLARIFDKGIDAAKKVFAVKRVERSFEAAKDSLDEQYITAESDILLTREKLCNAAKEGQDISSYIQALIDLQKKKSSIKATQEALATEMSELL